MCATTRMQPQTVSVPVSETVSVPVGIWQGRRKAQARAASAKQRLREARKMDGSLLRSRTEQKWQAMIELELSAAAAAAGGGASKVSRHITVHGTAHHHHAWHAHHMSALMPHVMHMSRHDTSCADHRCGYDSREASAAGQTQAARGTHPLGQHTSGRAARGEWCPLLRHPSHPVPACPPACVRACG